MMRSISLGAAIAPCLSRSSVTTCWRLWEHKGISEMKISVALAALLSATGIVADSDEGLPKLRIGTYSVVDLPLGHGWPQWVQ
jgi:hypothetical protein